MENLELILSSASAGAGLLATSVTFLVKFIKSAKAKKIAENVIKICAAVVPLIEQAERFSDYSGEEKKEFVMTKANQFAIDNGMPFDKALVSEKVEELVDLSKQINKREKDKGSTPTVMADGSVVVRAETIEEKSQRKPFAFQRRVKNI
jgi:hypothetical protein